MFSVMYFLLRTVDFTLGLLWKPLCHSQVDVMGTTDKVSLHIVPFIQILHEYRIQVWDRYYGTLFEERQNKMVVYFSSMTDVSSYPQQ